MDIVIGLVGAKGAGKSTTFKLMSEFWDVQEVALADKLKNTCSKVFDIPRNHFDSHEFKEKDLDTPVFLDDSSLRVIYKEYDVTPDYDKHIRSHIGKILETPRKVAQYVGSEVLRSISEDIHCTAAVKTANKAIVVITDIRFPNEYEFFAKNYKKFHLVYIQNTAAETTAGEDTHISEKYLKDLMKKAEYTINNNDDMKTLRNAVSSCFVKIFGS